MSLEEKFQQAADDMKNKVNPKLSNKELEDLYGLYKQGTVGDINIDKPGMFDFKGQAKYNAWLGRKGMSKEDAMTEYIKFVEEMAAKHGTK